MADKKFVLFVVIKVNDPRRRPPGKSSATKNNKESEKLLDNQIIL
jgi:hypothetical protein